MQRDDVPLDVLLHKYGVEPFVDPQLANVDETTARDLRELRARKLAAVGAEDFEYASQLKRADEHLQQLGAEILRLDNERIAAIACEEYDEAKALRARITWLQRDAARRKAVAIAAHGDPSPVMLEPPPEDSDPDAELLLAGPLTPADSTLAGPLVEVFGVHVATAALSAHWRARTAALDRIGLVLTEGPSMVPSAALADALAVPIARALSDVPVVPRTVAAATAVVRALAGASASAADGSAMDALIANQPALGALVGRAADADASSREAVVTACSALVEHTLLDATRAVPSVLALCAVPHGSQPWRSSLLGLQMLRTLLLRCRRLEPASAPSSLPLDALAEATSRGLRHPHAEVRAAAMEAAAAIHAIAPQLGVRILEGAPPSVAQQLAITFGHTLTDHAAEGEDAPADEGLLASGDGAGAGPGAPATMPQPSPRALHSPPDAKAPATDEAERMSTLTVRRTSAAVIIQKHTRGRIVRRLGGPAATAAERQELLRKRNGMSSEPPSNTPPHALNLTNDESLLDSTRREHDARSDVPAAQPSLSNDPSRGRGPPQSQRLPLPSEEEELRS